MVGSRVFPLASDFDSFNVSHTEVTRSLFMSRINEEVRRRFFAFSIWLVALALVVSPAAAGESLMDELPEGHDTVIAVDFTELRDSPLYDRAFEMLNANPAVKDSFQQMQRELGIDAKSDLDALVMTSNSPPLSAGLLNHPSGALDQAAAQESDGGLVLIRGDIEPETLLARLSDDSAAEGDEDVDEGEREASRSLRRDGVEITVLDERTVAIALGPTAYLDQAKDKLAAERSGPGSIFDESVRRLGANQGLYMMIQPTIEDPDRVRRQMGAVASFGALSLDLKNEVRLAGFLHLDSEENATALASQIDELRQEISGNPLASMLGFAPVLENLSVQQDGGELFIRTSMTNQQALRIARQASTLMARGQQLQQPLEGRGIGEDEQPETEASEEASPEDVPEPPEGGIEADFN